jgi:ABC-2 type transport system permease protein
MHKTLLVAWQQIQRMTLHWSFVLVVLYPPIITLILGTYFGFVIWAAGLQNDPQSLPAPGVFITNNAPAYSAVGLVDQMGITRGAGPPASPDLLILYPDEGQAHQAVIEGRIPGFYVIPADYVASGVVTYYSYDNVQFTETDAAIETLLVTGLAQPDGPQAAARAAAPITFDERRLTLPGGPPPAPETYTGAEVGLGVGIAAFVYFTIGSVCGMFLNQMARERQGRVLEVTLGAIAPGQLLAGKFAGIVAVGLLETGAWFFWVRVLSFLGVQAVGRVPGGLAGVAPADPAAPADLPGLLSSGLIFIGSYLAYVATAAVFGAVVKETRQASRINFVLVLAALSPLAVIIGVLADRDGAMAVVLSLLPFSAPIIMPLRIFVSAVPAWQVLLCFALSLAWTVCMLHLAARLFQARRLLDAG